MNNILHLVKIEWLKLSSYRAFKVLLILFAISVFGVNYVTHQVASLSYNGNNASMLIGTPFQFPSVLHTVSYLSSFLLFIPGLILILIMSNEFNFRTHRQNIIDGLSRSQFITAKIALVVIISIVLSILVFIIASLYGLIEGGTFSAGYLKYIVYFFIQSLSYTSIALVFAIMLRKSGLSIVLYFLYAFILEEILVASLNKIARPIGYFLPLESADKLVPVPLSLLKDFNQDIPNEMYFLAASIIWIAAALWFCRYKFLNSDL